MTVTQWSQQPTAAVASDSRASRNRNGTRRLTRPRPISARGAPRQPAKASLAAVELPNRGLEMVGCEVRPHGRGEHELSVCALPEQEIAQALLATRPDEQVH